MGRVSLGKQVCRCDALISIQILNAGLIAKTSEVDTLRFQDKDLLVAGTLEYGQFGVVSEAGLLPCLIKPNQR
jgi:hypothetical protein